jgi:hypothetical protein
MLDAKQILKMRKFHKKKLEYKKTSEQPKPEVH